MKGRRNMGLVTETVEVNLVGSNISYYEKLGYEIPRRKNHGEWCVPYDTKLLVIVNDLPKNSSKKVILQCDNCNQIYETTYRVYSKYNHNGKTYCNRCSNTVFLSGENHYKWDFNKTDEERKNKRYSSEYIHFIKSVLARDNYTCQCCNKKSEADMEVHHLYGFAGFPEYRTDQTQALCLCERCHKSFHSWQIQHYGFANKGNCTREQFEEWYGQAIKKLSEYSGRLPTSRQVYCYEENKIYDSPYDVAYLLKYSPSVIYAVCNHKHNTAYNKHWFWYDEYLNLSYETIFKIVSVSPEKHHNSNEKIVCVNTRDIITKEEACIKYNTSIDKIKYVLTHRKTSLKYNGMPLLFMYYSDYISKTENEIKEFINYTLSRGTRPVINLCSGQVFYTMKEAYLTLNITHRDVFKQCEKKIFDEVDYHFMYYKDFLLLTEEEQNNLLNLYKEE